MDLSELKKKSSLILSAGLAAFLVYFSMYAFRKPFAVATFQGYEIWGINYKIVLIISQVIGYTISKFIGIKVISEMKKERRPWLIIGFILLAELALLGFALVEPPYNFVFLFLNGLPLGMIWGLVFSYLEGRNITEILATILSASFIMASGVTKAVGKYLLLEFSVSEFWMPFLTGLIFLIPLLFSVWWLEKIPSPTKEDILLRKERLPMTKTDKKKLFWGLFPGLMALIVMYLFLTAFRDYRDNFSAEIWIETGLENSASIFAKTETYIAFLALSILALFVFIKDNLKAVKTMILVMILGLISIAITTYLFHQHNALSPFTWMTITGLGAYIAYIPLGSMLFDRIISALSYKGNAGFLIYIADAIGYVGSVFILFYKEFFYKDLSILNFFINFSYITFFVGLSGLTYAYFYFNSKINKHEIATNN